MGKREGRDALEGGVVVEVCGVGVEVRLIT